MGKDKKEDVDLSNEENKGGFGTYIDDDQLFSDSMSLRRRLSIIEKVLIFVAAIVTVPLTATIGKLLDPNFFNPFEADTFLVTLPAYIVSFVILVYAEMAAKNVSISKGLLKTTLISVFFSLSANEISFAFIVPYTGGSDASKLPLFLALGGIAAAVYTVVLLIVRLILVVINRENKKYAIIIGPRDDAESLARKIIKENKDRFSIRYIFYEENGVVSDRIYDKVKKVNSVILLDSLSSHNKEKFLIYFNSSLNKDVYVCSNYYDLMLLNNNTVNINEKLSFEQTPLIIDRVEAFSKRTWDIILSILALALTLPVWLIIPLAIKLQDGGPVFYTQIRLTKGMKPFRIIKFRSMRVDAEKFGAQLAEENDPRITKIGHFIRATRIDELPQLLNIFKGDMSWVGPRPERPEFVKEFLEEEPLYRYRYNVKAGLTGLQQVSATYHTDFRDKLKYDLYYIAKQSTIYDFVILFRTIGVVFQKGMAEGVDDSKENFPDFLMEQGILSHIHWDYRSLFYSKSVDKSKQTLLKETLEMTMEMKSTDAKGKTEVKTWMPKGSNDDVDDGKD